MRRLTVFEYNNTLRDLLDDPSSPGNAFPSELSGNGFGNDADSQPVGSELANQYVLVSETVAAAVTAPARIATLAPCAAQIGPTSDAASEASCVRTVLDGLLPKALRRAVLAGETDSFLALFQSVRPSSDFPTSLATVIEAVLQSPELIYKPELGTPVAGKPHLLQPTGYEMATRLSYLYWASMPDDQLRAAAAAGSLSTPEGVRAQAERLLNHARTREVVHHFFDKLLPISELSSLARDAVKYPDYSPQLGAFMREETQTFLEDLIFGGGPGAPPSAQTGSWPMAMTASHSFLNEELAAFYGVPGVTGASFRWVDMSASPRRGLLTQAGVLAGPIHTNHENPVVRGSFVVQKLLCTPIPFPTGAIASKVTPPDPESAATARQRFTQHSKDPVCRGCHVSMDGIGYALENYDVIGQYRTQENGVTIDASGESPLLAAPFNGAAELGQRISESPGAQDCFATQWMNFGYGRTLQENEICSMQSVQSKFKDAGYNIKELLLALTQSDAFLYLPAVRE
ncbi:MAG TPA: DUF1592 domain-containing protein [Polyangiaceae bacterium]